MRNWFFTVAFLTVSTCGFMIFLGFLAFLTVAKMHLKPIIMKAYSIGRKRVKKVKKSSRKSFSMDNNFSQEPTDDQSFSSRNMEGEN